MNDRCRVVLLIAIMITVALGVGGATLVSLYDAAILQQRQRLIEAAHDQASLIEAMARFEERFRAGELPEEASAATLARIREAYEHSEKIGNSGEFLLAGKEGDRIVFRARHRGRDSAVPEPLPFGSELAEPMRRALSGERGTCIGPDHRGHLVLAAFEPLPTLGLGLVSKIDLSEIRAPFVEAGVRAGSVALILVVLGALGFRRFLAPLLSRLAENESRYRALVEAMPNGIAEVDADGGIIFCNSSLRRILGYAEGQLEGTKVTELVAEASREEVSLEIEKLLAGGELEAPYSHPHLTSDGRTIDMEAAWGLKRNDRGETVALIAVLSDVTERLLDKNALLEQKNRFEAIFNSVPDAMCLTDADRRLLMCNPGFCRISGYRPEELLGRKCRGLYASEEEFERQGRLRFNRRAKIDPAPFTIDYRRKSGEIFPGESVSTAIRDGGGETLGYLIVTRDISDRSRAEEGRRKSEARFRAIFESAGTGMATLTPEGKLLTANQAMLSFLSYSESELREVYHCEVTHPKDVDKCRRLLEKSIDEGRSTWSYEKRYLRRDGTIVHGSVSSTWLFDEEGKPEQIVDLVQDITERKRAEALVRKNEARFKKMSREFQALLNGIPDAITLLSPDGKILWANLGAARAFNHDQDQLLGLECHRLWKNCAPDYGDCPVHKSFSRGETADREHKDENGRIWEVRTFPVKGEDGKVISVIQLACDTTETSRLRAEALRSGQLASLGELAAGVGHEINNPINGIINYAQLLADNFDTHIRGRGIAEKIIEEGNRIAGIVSSLLTFARDTEEVREPTGIGTILDSPLTLTESQLSKDGIRLELKMPTGRPEVLANKEQIQQVVLNMISNARYALNRKYSGPHEDKVLTVSAEPMQQKEGAYVRLSFLDNGIGIEEKVLDKIMDPFFSTKPSGEGTGLGLSISHGIVTKHGGKLSIDSIEGEYTRVDVDLPAAKR